MKERLKQLRVEPVFYEGEELRAVIRARSEELERIQLEKPPALPPLHWLVLAFVGFCGVLVWREKKPE